MPSYALTGRSGALGEVYLAQIVHRRLGLSACRCAEVPVQQGILGIAMPPGPYKAVNGLINTGPSGLDVCRALRMSESYEALPIFIVTGQTDDHTRLSAFRAGASDVVAKPVLPEELRARLGVQLERVGLLRDRADKDSLSGLLTRRALVEAFQRALASATRDEKPLSLALLDIDKFKRVNDTYGHLSGDEVIAQLGDLLQRRFRLEDLRGRWGGEEFILVFPGQNVGFAERAAALLLGEFSQLSFASDDGQPFTATFTAGVAAYPEDGTSVPALVRRADERLYAGKQGGRNQVVAAAATASRPSEAGTKEQPT